MKPIVVFVLFPFSVLFVQPVFAQQQAPADTAYIAPTPKEKEDKRLANKTANHAALLSAVCPGLGQIYNKKYWKPPIIYVGIGVLGYLIYDYSGQFNDYRRAYNYRIDNNVLTDPTYGRYTNDQLKLLRDDARRYMQLDIILLAGLYTLNIVDAYVDAHLTEFDVNEDLSMKIRPLFYAVNYSHLAPGLCLSFRLK